MDVFGYGGPGDQEKASSLKMIKIKPSCFQRWRLVEFDLFGYNLQLFLTSLNFETKHIHSSSIE